MGEIIQSHQVNVSAREAKAVNVEVETNSISDFWQKIEFNRFGITPMLLGIIAIFGGFAGAAGIQESSVTLAVVTVPTMFALSLILAVIPMRTIVISCTIALIIDLLVIIF